MMRTTLDIADDVFHAAKERARHQRKTMGEVISELARNALNASAAITPRAYEPQPLHGFRAFPKRESVVTNDLIDKLRDDDAY
jgi:hypothetical protein